MHKIINQHTVLELSEKMRLSDYLVGIFPELPSRKSAKKAIKAKRILVNNLLGHTGTWLQANDQIALLEPLKVTTEPFRLALEIIYEDDHFALINKPAGIVVSGNQFRTISNTLTSNLKPSTQVDALEQPRPVHRLDAPTSGLLIVAKTSRSCISFNQQFSERSIQKQYAAILTGQLEESVGRIEKVIDGKKAITDFAVQKVIPSLQSTHLSWVHFFPKTGRTHQLRIHAASLGCPILGDTLYGRKGKILQGKGLFLAAIGLELEHPMSKKRMTFRMTPPNKFQRRWDLEKRRWKKFNLQSHS